MTHEEAELAIRKFISWLYDDCPVHQDEVTRERLYLLWTQQRGTKPVPRYISPISGRSLAEIAELDAAVSKVTMFPQKATHDDIERWQKSGELHRAVGLPPPEPA